MVSGDGEGDYQSLFIEKSALPILFFGFMTAPGTPR